MSSKLVAFKADKETQYMIEVLRFKDAILSNKVSLHDVSIYAKKKVGL